MFKFFVKIGFNDFYLLLYQTVLGYEKNNWSDHMFSIIGSMGHFDLLRIVGQATFILKTPITIKT